MAKATSKIIPIGDRVLVKPFTESEARGEKKKSVLILPGGSEKERSSTGKVLAVGEVKKVKVGDVVIFSKYSYDEVESGGEMLYLLKEENIFAIIK